MSDPLARLDEHQRALLEEWLPGLAVVADHSWGLVETRVLEVTSSGRTWMVKAGGPTDHHIAREIRAHREWTGPWVASGHAAALRHADVEARLLVTDHLPGRLVEGTEAQDDPETYRQAGALIARFHAQHAQVDDTWYDRLRDRVRRGLDSVHRIAPAIEEQVRAELDTWAGGPATVVPTHGDWQPRNWLVDGPTVRAIDFGRADLRPVEEDFSRLSNQDFARDPALATAFFEGYGRDPREPRTWRYEQVGVAVGTATWAHQVGDEDFEEFGHGLLRGLYAGRAPEE
ncbi:phosphotransferase [Nocardioides sp. J2M5]|uniref:phosphotransferase n=1 Tax=Nocardioides palaemonis TaxID=2829810 RepID=UPI001BA8FB8E|nr:phosphotransferase [Nocardioides palaemonis]MBS2938735.1 phosphotransferase [Nocardioides palaemonis]